MSTHSRQRNWCKKYNVDTKSTWELGLYSLALNFGFLKTTTRSSLSGREFNNYVYKTTIIILLKNSLITSISPNAVGNSGFVCRSVATKESYSSYFNVTYGRLCLDLYLIKDISIVKAATAVIERDDNVGLRSSSKENIGKRGRHPQAEAGSKDGQDVRSKTYKFSLN
uniref:Uncharacterized protein n=1 Tax=Glossina pallidipes TaxID=7398 RepID=A0A1A9ZLY5_GLOPL